MAQSRIILPGKRWPDGRMENANRSLGFVFPCFIRIGPHQMDLRIGKFKTQLFFYLAVNN